MAALTSILCIAIGLVLSETRNIQKAFGNPAQAQFGWAKVAGLSVTPRLVPNKSIRTKILNYTGPF
jgi:hypothetical protein